MAETAKDLVKKDLKENKLKVPELDEKTKKHLEQMSMLEMRAELEPYFIDNPLARLGFDIIERGEAADGTPGGKIYSYIIGDSDVAPAYTVFGEMVTPDSLDPKNEYSDDLSNFRGNLAKQGIETLLPSSKGAAVFFQQGIAREDGELKFKNSGKYTKPRQGLTTLMHELGHLGAAKVIQDLGYKFDDAMDEEDVMDLMEARSVREQGVPVLQQSDVDLYERYPYFSEKELKRADEAALTALRQRGVPPQATQGRFKYEPPKPTMMERLLGMFN